jgi:hypothetical protein
MTIKILEDLKVAGFDLKKGPQPDDLPDHIKSSLVFMGFAEEVKTPKAKAEEK